jgi:hypothetical protein
MGGQGQNVGEQCREITISVSSSQTLGGNDTMV